MTTEVVGDSMAAMTRDGVVRAPLWIDGDDAQERIDDATVPDYAKQAATDLRRDGIAVLRKAIDVDLCHKVIQDYGDYVASHRGYVDANRDALGREKRLVNFHLYSDAAAKVGTNPRTMEILDFVFGLEACAYTSLTFKYGSQQPVHRDTPHFATWPPNYFVGVWTALEPVHRDAGPLFYHPGAHRFGIDKAEFMRQAVSRLPTAPRAEQYVLALDLYNGEVIRRSPTISAPVSLQLDIGDSVIWHAELPHGGLPANDPHRTRWSIVFHCAPVAVQVHQHDAFFGNLSSEPPPPRYGFREFGGRKLALSGDVAYM